MGATPSLDVLFLAAHRLELAALLPALGLELDGEAGDCADPVQLHGRLVAAAEVGVGAFAAGAGSMAALMRRPPRAALLLGSFGAYPAPDAPAIGSLLVPSALLAIDAACAEGRAVMPDAMAARAQCDPVLCAALAAHSGATLATTPSITTDDALAASLARASGCAGENLEALAVALACARAGVVFAAVLACTNEVGARGRAQWAANHARAARDTADCALAWLAAGAPGLVR